MTRIRIAACTDPGARGSNEDDLRHGHGPSGTYAVLADGAGGHARGREAAQRAVASIERALGDIGVGFAPGSLTQIVRGAHADIQQRQDSNDRALRMHATVVVLWVAPDERHVLWSNVGDSRLYRVRHGRADVLTQDDSVVHQMMLAGVLTAEQSRRHPQKNHLIAALGIEGGVEPHTVLQPAELREGDAFLLCSDGWWDGFEPEDLALALARAYAPEDWLADLAQRIRARAAPRQDNFSAIAVWVGEPAEMTIARLNRAPAPR
ncbi:MAG: serine/threonine-protein phosphatase [Proteobacteria bacterium]|nr:serine/threonine-protein phosphatase [Pseudomonadota bacterium]